MNQTDFQSLVERLKNILAQPYQSAEAEHPDDQLLGTDKLDPAGELEPDAPYQKHPAQGRLVGELEERYRDFLKKSDSEAVPEATITTQTTKTPQELAAEKQTAQAATKLAQTSGARPEDLKTALDTTAQGQVPTGAQAQALASMGDDISKALADPQLSQQLLRTVQAAKTQK